MIIQQLVNNLFNLRAQPVAELLQPFDDSSCESTAAAALRCFKSRGRLCFYEYFQKQDEAKWEQDKERETDNVSDDDEQGEQDSNGT